MSVPGLLLCAGLAAATPDARRPMALVVVWDGLRADAVANAEVPHLKALANGAWQPGYRGAWSLCAKPVADARPYSFPNHASILNGVNATRHGVFFNHDTAKCRTESCPTWLSRLLDARPGLTAEYTYACGDSNWDLCRDARVRHRDFGTNDWAHADHMVARYASADAPDAAVMFLEEPDFAGHVGRAGHPGPNRGGNFYPSGSAYRAAVADCDAVLGRVLAAIAARPSFAREDWLIAVTSDHGGYGNAHGWLESHSMTTPLVLAGRRVVNGQLRGFPRGQDLPATMLAHFGVDVRGFCLDSEVLGADEATWGAAKSVGEGLRWHFPLDEKDRVPVSRTAYGCRLFGDEHYCHYSANGPFGGWCRTIAGSEGVPCGLALEGSVDAFPCRRPSFTLSVWLRMAVREQPCVILGNRDFARAGSPGFVLTLGDRIDSRTSRGVTLRFGTPRGEDRAVGTMDVEDGIWEFYAVSFTPDGQAWLFQGRSDGLFHWVCDHAENALLASGLPLRIGNDGTGEYRWNFRGDAAELAVWTRALTAAEVETVFRKGRMR